MLAKEKLSWIKKKLLKRKKAVVWGSIVFLFILLIGIPAYVFFINPFGSKGLGPIRYLPIPVAIVDGQATITLPEFVQDSNSLKNFYLSQDFSSVGMRIDFSTEEGKLRLNIKEKDVLDKLIENEIISVLAKQRNIEVTTQDAERELNKKISQLGDRQALELNLKQRYNWSLGDFRDKVVKNQLLIKKLSEYFYTHQKTDQASYTKIQQAKKELKADGSNFTEIAQKYSDGESRKNGGELGWFAKEQMTPEVAQVVYAAKAGTVTDIIQSSLGYHIVMVEEFRDAPGDENKSNDGNVLDSQSPLAKEVRIRQIFIQGGGFIDWLKQEKMKTKVLVFMKDYKWNSSEGRLIFKDPQKNKAEQLIRAKSQGDPSMQ